MSNQTVEKQPLTAGAEERSKLQKFSSFAKRRGQGVSLVLTLVFFVLSIGFLTFGSEPEPPTTQASLDQGILLQFGLSRETITRSLRIDLCPDGGSATYAECTPSPDGETARPEISGVTLESDLVDQKTKEQFPIGQFTVSATNVGRTGLLVVVSANPASPEDVPAGSYVGELLIDRVGESDPIPLRLEASLADRDAPDVALRVLLALSVGALAGTLLKWLDESFSPLAGLRRRQRRVEHFLQPSKRELPEGVKLRLEQVRRLIRSFDAEGVGLTLDEIVKNQDALVAFASATRYMDAQIRMQAQLLDAADMGRMPEVRSAIELERERLRELRTEVVWPWAAADEVATRLKKEKEQFRALTLSMRRVAFGGLPADRDRLSTVALRTLADETSGDGQPESQDRHPQGAPHAVTVEAIDPVFIHHDAADDEHLPESEERRTVGLWLLDNAWWLTLAATALVVVFFGYQSEFLREPRFEGDSLDYFSLAAWALAIQLAGGTILETMGRLRTSKTAV